ncbi:MAG: saccharopine dehydrogenase NADP-binding domain-containing protein [Candidatus Marinimicrobia bacterium]|nr:saccharopine dehydrogenase NADP-binding domain-containing protein [Candidatus Neomarinimicrobiota bacterium]
MANVYVIGAGMVGSAMALDLANDHQVHLADYHSVRLSAIQKRNSSIITERLDVTDEKSLLKWLEPANIILMGVPGHLGYPTLKTTISGGKNIVDISFAPENILELSPLAEKAGISVIVDAGVAPGIPNYILGYYNTLMEIQSFEYLVGGLPKYPRPPFNYKAPFSPIDVIEEYTRPARMMINGKVVSKPALTEIESIDFPDAGKLEAFNTDGLRSILTTMNHIPNMKEKTLRYPGHGKLMKSYRDQGLFNTSNIEKTSKKLFKEWKLDKDEPEFTIMDIIIKGNADGEKQEVKYHLYDEYDPKTKTSSMSRTTGYTAAATVNLLLNNLWTEPGVFPPEIVGKKEGCTHYILDYLRKRNVQINKQ